MRARRRALRPVTAYAPRVLGVPVVLSVLSVFGLIFAVLLTLSAVPSGPGYWHPGHPPKPPGADGWAAAPFAVSGAASALEFSAFGSSALAAVPSGAQAGQPRCSDDPLDAQTPRIEASDSRPGPSAADADGLPVSGLPIGAPPQRAGRPPTDARGGAGPPLWLRTCVSRT